MSETSDRKLEHLDIARMEGIERREYDWFSDVLLVHEASSDLSFEEVSLNAEFAGKRVSAPLIIEGMTGGHKTSAPINEALASAAQKAGIPMGVGSQRAAIEDPSLAHTFEVAREAAPDIPLIANLGATHVFGRQGLDNAVAAIDMISADALAIHLNPLQEIIQPEGTASFGHFLDSLKALTEELDIPVIAKETGCGISMRTASLLEAAGTSGIDVAGFGGTNWALIEGKRSSPGSIKSKAAETFLNWGIPTPISILEASSSAKGLFIIGSGGVRSGLDAAKCIALGAAYAGAALPFLRAYYKGGAQNVLEEVRKLTFELKTALFLSGASNPEELRRKASYVLMGRVFSWAWQRNLISPHPRTF